MRTKAASLDDNPVDTLVRARDLLALYQSVEWEEGSLMANAPSGGFWLLADVSEALDKAIAQLMD